MSNLTQAPSETAANDQLRFVPKRDKIVEGMLLLVEQAGAEATTLNVESAMMAMFLADKSHLDDYGRPVSFDNYIAAKIGPRGEAVSGMLGAGCDWSTLGVGEKPWSVELTEGERRLHANRKANRRRLSETDVEHLTEALAIVIRLSDDELRQMALEQPAYAAAWLAGEGTRLDPRLIPDDRDDELIYDLVRVSQHAFMAPYRS